MPQDAFTLKYVIKELNETLRGGKVSRINQPEKDELTLFIYTANGTVKLEICAHAQNCRINLGDEGRSPKAAASFCMLLRKHLQNATVLSVTQPGFERIAEINFDCTSDFERAERTLYCEIMGKYSNVILVEGGRILGAMKTTSLESGAHRILFTGAKYELPAPQDKTNPDDLNTLEETFSAAGLKDADFIANRVTGICYSTALDIEAAFGGDATAKNVYDYVHGEFFQPCVTFRDGKPNDFKVCCHVGEKKLYPNLLAAQSAYYSYVCAKKAFDDKKRKLEGALRAAEKKCEKRLGIILGRLSECRDIEDVKLKGELITANIYAVERGADSLKAVNYYDEAMPEVTIPLDPRLTPAQNAQKYYKRYAKLKRTVAALDIQRAQTEEERDYLKSIKFSLENAEEITDFEEAETELISLGLIKQENEAKGRNKKKETPRAPFRTYSCEGFTIVAGRNNIQNERLTKGLKEGDMWLHTQRYHSAHVGIISDGRQIPESVIKVAAEICAYYSEAKDDAKVPVDYTPKKYVKKPSGAKPGFVVYTDYKTALAEPKRHDELALDEA